MNLARFLAGYRADRIRRHIKARPQKITGYIMPDGSKRPPGFASADERLALWLLVTCDRCRNSLQYLLHPPLPAATLEIALYARFLELPYRHQAKHLRPVSADDAVPHEWNAP